MNTVFIIIYAIVMFLLLIVLHEFGHFLAAKISGVQVNEFSVGMGPRLWGIKKGETEYSIRAIPFGGYCSLEGETDFDDDGNIVIKSNPRSLEAQPLANRILIFLMGPFFNILICIVMLLIIYLALGNGLWISLRGAFRATGYYMAVIWQSLWEIIKGNVKGDDVMGIVGMAGVIKDEAQYGITNVSFLLASLSANFALMNLIPLPALDGGKVIMAIFKSILKDKYSVKVEIVLNAICIVLLFALMGFLIIKDSIHLFA